jgi:hypothetical protein
MSSDASTAASRRLGINFDSVLSSFRCTRRYPMCAYKTKLILTEDDMAKKAKKAKKATKAATKKVAKKTSKKKK